MSRRFEASPKRLAGFTIVELLIATAVFSVVLLLVTAGIMQITRVYYKGITESTTQNTARNIIDTISQAIQFTGGNVTPTASNTNYFCVGDEQFTYRLGWQVKDGNDSVNNQIWHALVQGSSSGGCGSAGTVPLLDQEDIGARRDLVGENMRLSALSVEPVGGTNSMYRVSVKVVYGDNDLLSSPATGPNTGCLGQQAGSAFCSVAELSTIVVKRVQ